MHATGEPRIETLPSIGQQQFFGDGKFADQTCLTLKDHLTLKVNFLQISMDGDDAGSPPPKFVFVPMGHVEVT